MLYSAKSFGNLLVLDEMKTRYFLVELRTHIVIAKVVLLSLQALGGRREW